MWQRSSVTSDAPGPGSEKEFRDRMRANFWAAIVTTALVAAGAWIASEFAESYQGGCYRPGGSCEAWDVPAATIGFDDFWQ